MHSNRLCSPPKRCSWAGGHLWHPLIPFGPSPSRHPLGILFGTPWHSSSSLRIVVTALSPLSIPSTSSCLLNFTCSMFFVFSNTPASFPDTCRLFHIFSIFFSFYRFSFTLSPSFLPSQCFLTFSNTPAVSPDTRHLFHFTILPFFISGFLLYTVSFVFTCSVFSYPFRRTCICNYTRVLFHLIFLHFFISAFLFYTVSFVFTCLVFPSISIAPASVTTLASSSSLLFYLFSSQLFPFTTSPSLIFTY